MTFCCRRLNVTASTDPIRSAVATLVFFGDAAGASEAQLTEAIGSNTAAVAYYVKQQPEPGELSLEDTVRIARAKKDPVIVDAASRIWPLDYFRAMANSGDLVCFGGKYVGGPQSAGFVCGNKDLVSAVRDHGFVSARPLGRAMKTGHAGDRRCSHGH